jgi:hypothetical protein
MPMKKNVVHYVLTNGKKVLLLALSVIAICDNDLHPPHLSTRFSLRMRLTDSHSLPKAGGQPYCLYLQGLNTSLCNRSLILSFIRRSETFHRFLAIATLFYTSSIGWQQYTYSVLSRQVRGNFSPPKPQNSPPIIPVSKPKKVARFVFPPHRPASPP